MRLTCWLFRRNRMPHGNIFTGKDRFVREVTPKNIKHRIWNYEIEENNMLLLRHPYLTEEQSHGHARALNKKEQFVKKHHDEYRLRRRDDVLISRRLKHLGVKDSWEVY